ncbi:Activating signal cointegrator 1 complex subunit 1 [Armadillidium vulgare]|nr:Activating signal cointegrator 1 complex subunit 1 [Armadillidium vulgare]
MGSQNVCDINILQPSTLWINKRCYRVLLPNSNISGSYMEDDVYPEYTYKDELECQLDFDIPFDQLSNGKFKTSFAVASSYLPYIIGGRGATKHRIENETYTQIKIPSKGQVGDVVIIGKDMKTVRQARIKIELLVDQAKRRQPFTHFISIPFNQDVIQESFIKFKNEALERFGEDRGVESSLFQNQLKLHMTICPLVLSDDRERQNAVKALKDCHLEIMNEYIQVEPLRIEIKGIEYLNDDPSEVDVLYGKVQSVSWAYSLQDIVDDLVRKLVKSGVASKQYESVKLHVTLMNTLFRTDKDGTSNNTVNKDKDRETFDARNILKEFKDYYFGEVEISELHLSVRYSTASNGYYTSSCKLSLLPR